MKFNHIDDFAHFQDGTILWVTLSDIPDDVKNRAMAVDGETYDKSGFGICVTYYADTQKFGFMGDMDQEEAHSIYYISNDCEIFWFECEVPEKVTKRIFSECRKILDLQKVEGGYRIKKSIQFEDNSGFIFATKSNSERPFLTAHFTESKSGQRSYYEQKSFQYKKDAIENYTSLAEYQKQFLSVKTDPAKADEHHKKETNQNKGKKTHHKRKRR